MKPLLLVALIAAVTAAGSSPRHGATAADHLCPVTIPAVSVMGNQVVPSTPVCVPTA